MAVEATLIQPTALSDTPLHVVPRLAELAPRRVELAGARIDRVDLALAVSRISGFLADGARHQIVTVNLDFLRIARQNDPFREAINRADLAVADGMPLVWVSRLKNDPLPERVTGNELVDECCALAAAAGRGVFLLGAGEGVAAVAAEKLQERHPGLRIAGVYSPPFGPPSASEDDHIIELINAATPAFLFVALGAPRQDLWIQQHLHRLDVSVAMGVGCVLDLLAGNVQRAPAWMQRGGLEWTYRLMQEPGRLWRRYFMEDIPVLGRLVWEALRQPAEPLSVSSAALGNPPA